MPWCDALKETKESAWYKDLIETLNERLKQETIYPPKEDWFNALTYTEQESVKVVILGQDPYHQKKQANGLAFSVNKKVKIPPSLRNIFKEVKSDLNIDMPSHGDLTPWAKQGVLLLNTTLTVKEATPLSHKALGWETFTDTIIELVSKNRDHVVFMLWGKHAQSKEYLIDSSKHLILKAPHPSPLSAHRGFLGCKHFSKGNAYLIKHGQSPIKYEL